MSTMLLNLTAAELKAIEALVDEELSKIEPLRIQRLLLALRTIAEHTQDAPDGGAVVNAIARLALDSDALEDGSNGSR